MAAQPRTLFFASDLHGRPGRYRALLDAAREERPDAILLGGDLLPHPLAMRIGGDASAAEQGEGEELTFLDDVFRAGFAALREELGDASPRVVVVPGNDDAAADDPFFEEGEREGLWTFAVERVVDLGGVPLIGYAYVPPTPFALKDRERYDVSRFVDPGCVSPEEGRRSVPVDERRARFRTIAGDLERLAHELEERFGKGALHDAILLAHSPPHNTPLDRAALDGKMIDHVPLDVHVGSIALRRFVERRGPRVSLHGHVHESARITGAWKTRLGATWAMTAAHEGEELALVRVDLDAPGEATRDLLAPRPWRG